MSQAGAFGKENVGIRNDKGGEKPPLSLLIPTFSFLDAPEYLTVRLRR